MAWLSWLGKRAEPTIASLTFSTEGWEPQADSQADRMRAWLTPDGDGVSLHFFPLPPDLPAGPAAQSLRDFYLARLKSVPRTQLVECSERNVAGVSAVELIIKVAQQPSGMTYQASWTVPFRDFSYVIKVQCPERGTTGIREAILFDLRRRSGEQPRLDGKGPFFENWNPDAQEFDAMFATHPLSRARRRMLEIIATSRTDPAVAALPKLARFRV